MTNLEFIEKEIEKEKITIRVNTSLLSHFDKEDDVANNVLSTKIMKAEDRLKNLKQIKSELEAWEIAKSKEIDILSVKTALDLESFNIDLVKAYQLTEEEFNKLKKELGEENES